MKLETQIKLENNSEFQGIIQDLIENPTVQEMKNFRQHFDTSCYEHCYLAAYYCYILCKKFSLNYCSATRAAMLHDLFLYDWRKKTNRHGLHAFTHGKTACENACKLFKLNDKEKDMIIKHMWPVTLSFPKSIEGFILTFVDKYCAIQESIEGVKLQTLPKRLYHYAYVLFTVTLLKRIL